MQNVNISLDQHIFCQGKHHWGKWHASSRASRCEVDISPTFGSTSCNITETIAGVCLALPEHLILWSDVMPWFCTLGREIGRVSLPCVAWNGGTPSVHRQLVLHSGRRVVHGFNFLWLFGRVSGPFLCSMFPGFSFPVSCLHVLGFGPISPVTVWERHGNTFDGQGLENVWFEKSLITTIYAVLYLKLMISNFLSR